MTLEVTIDVQCYPIEKQIERMRRPIQAVALALYKEGNLKPYQIAQSLDTMRYFWERVERGDISLEDFENDFNGEARKARLLAEAKAAAEAAAQQPTSGGQDGGEHPDSGDRVEGEGLHQEQGRAERGQ